MEKSRLELKVGLFVFVGLVLLAALLVQFAKGTSLFRGAYTLNLRAENVGGLKQNASVLLAGVAVGTVQKIEIEPSGTNVMITLQIYKKYPIFHDARFVIEASGFLGDQYVSVVPSMNQPPLLTNGQEVECEAPFNLQDTARSAAGFIQRLDDTAKKLDSSINDLRSQVLNAQTLANFSTTITNLRIFTQQAVDTVNDLNALIGTNGAQVTAAVSNVVVFSAQLNELGNSASNILATNGVNLTAATKNIQDLTVNAQQLLTDIQAGKGAAGALLGNPEVSTNIQLLAENLSIASSNLNRYGLWHFLWSHPPASTNDTKSKSPPSRK